MNILEELDSFWAETTGFDYVDRIIVFLYLTLSMMVFVFTLSQHLTPAEAAEIAPAFDALGYLLLFFFAWPVIRLAIDRGHQRIVRYWNERGETA